MKEDIKIYRPSQYVKEEDRAEPWLHLDVINMWDCKIDAICFDKNCSLCLKTSTKIEIGHYSSILVINPSKEILDEIKNMGYTLAKKFTDYEM